MAMFKILKPLLNLLQIDSPKNEMFFCTRLHSLKGISKAIYDLVLNVFLEGTKSSFTQNGEVPFQYIKTFVAMCCSVLSFVGWQFISLAPI